MIYYTPWWTEWRLHAPHLRPGLKIISTLAGPMIPIETLRAQCEMMPIDADTDQASGVSHPDDPLLLGYLDAAIEHAEDITGLSIALREYELALDAFPWGNAWNSWGIAGRNNGIELPRSPLISVDSFFSPEGGSSDGEFDLGDDYTIDDFHVPARLLPVSSWPSMIRSTNAIRIKFRAGYRTDDYFDTDYDGATYLPNTIKQALLLLVAHFHENRADGVEKALSTIPRGFADLLAPKSTMMGFA